MSEPSYALQVAIVRELDNKTVAGPAVFDKVTPGIFPRISIGSGQVLADDADCVDGFDVYFQIDCWSDEENYKQVKLIAGEVWKLLHKKDVPISGFNLIDLRIESTDFSRDDVQGVNRARMAVKAYMETI